MSREPGPTTAPNIVVVIADDMGVHQLGCYGSGFYETPHIDRLAERGARFTAAYSTSPVCSPARAALYTGLHPARLHLTNYIPGTVPQNPRLLTPPWRPYLPVETVTLGDALRERGYATGHFGKWHLAYDYQYTPGRPTDPESQGFEQVVVTRKPPPTADPEADPHHVQSLTDAAIRFISQPRSAPFLCVVAHNSLHRPELAPARLVAKYASKPGADLDSQRPVIAAMVEELDQSVGRLTTALRERGLEENTLFVFTSDHGAFGRSSERKPLRGAKADLYEGGLRVPLIFSQPSKVVPGIRDSLTFGTDLFPTLLDATKGNSLATPDARSLHLLLQNPASPPPDRDALCWHFPHYHHLGLAPSGAIRSGAYKLIEWFDRSIGGANDGPAFELYHLGNDPAEQENLAAIEPARCAALAKRLQSWRHSVGAQEMVRNPDFDPSRGPGQALPPAGDPGNPYFVK